MAIEQPILGSRIVEYKTRHDKTTILDKSGQDYKTLTRQDKTLKTIQDVEDNTSRQYQISQDKMTRQDYKTRRQDIEDNTRREDHRIEDDSTRSRQDDKAR